MNPDTAGNEAAAQAATPGGESAGAGGALEDARFLWDEWRGLVGERFRLAGLEARQAGESLVMMVVAGVVAGFLLGGAWTGLMVAVVLGLVERGVTASSALLLAVGLNVLALLLISIMIRRKLNHLQFPATLRSLQTASPAGKP